MDCRFCANLASVRIALRVILRAVRNALRVHVIVVVASRVRVAGDVDELLATHHRLVGRRRDPAGLGAGRAVVDQSHTDVQSSLVVRSTAPIDDPSWQVDRLNLEDIVLAYMSGAAAAGPERVLEGQR